MSELSFEQMLEESLKTIRTGEIVTGKVIDVKEDEIVLNIGYKSDGIIPRSEYTNEANVDLRTQVQVGDEMEAKVVKVNDGEGQVALSYKRLAADKGNKRLEEAFENHEVLTAKVAQVLDGGLSCFPSVSAVFQRLCHIFFCIHGLRHKGQLRRRFSIPHLADQFIHINALVRIALDIRRDDSLLHQFQGTAGGIKGDHADVSFFSRFHPGLLHGLQGSEGHIVILADHHIDVAVLL